MLLVELDIIKNMIGRVADRGPFGRLLLWIDDMVCAIAEQKLGLNILLCAGDNTGSAQFFDEGGRFQGVLEVAADGHKADIIVSNAQGTKKFFVCGVTDLRTGDKGQDLVDPILSAVYCHDLVAKLRQLYGDVVPKMPCADQ